MSEVRGDAGNVVYLTEEHGIAPGPPSSSLEPNARASDYAQVTPAGHSTYSVQGDPFTDFFADGPSAWLEDEDEEQVPIDTPRIVGSLLGWGSLACLAAAWVLWISALVRGAGGAEAGGFVLAWMMLWVGYLSLPRRRQHAVLLRLHELLQGLVERRVMPIRSRTEGQLAMRRERDRYRAMGDERARRVSVLGESAYRAFRQGALPVELHPGAQRVLAIEQQMLVQDQRISSLVADANDGADAAAEASSEGQSEA